MRPLALLTVIVLTAALTTAAGAMTFNNPPDQNDNFDGWVNPFPYQRNAFIGFNTDPSTWPTDANVAGAKDLIPGADGNYDLEGTLDSSLYDSDYMTITGAYDWIASDAVAGRTGLIGINDRANALVLAEWHLDNLPFHNGPKNCWLEFEIYTAGAVVTELLLSGDNPDQEPERAQLLLDELTDGWYRYSIGLTFETNPNWETLSLQISSGDDGGTVLVDYLHMATECNGGPQQAAIPEPATIALFGTGIAGIAAFMRRRAQG